MNTRRIAPRMTAFLASTCAILLAACGGGGYGGSSMSTTATDRHHLSGAHHHRARPERDADMDVQRRLHCERCVDRSADRQRLAGRDAHRGGHLRLTR